MYIMCIMNSVPDFSALAMLPKNIPMNHSSEYWYIGSILAYNVYKCIVSC